MLILAIVASFISCDSNSSKSETSEIEESTTAGEIKPSDEPTPTDGTTYAEQNIALEETSSHEHISSEWMIDKTATCKEQGSRYKECTACKTVLETEAIEKLTMHTPAAAVRENFVNSDCEHEGSYSMVVYCSLCEAKLSSETHTVEKQKHQFSQKNTDSHYLKTSATYTSSAIYYYSCSCGERGTDTFSYGSPLMQTIPISEAEFKRIIDLSDLRDFTLNATVSRQFVYYDVAKNLYTIQTITENSVSYVNASRYLYESEDRYTFASPSISPYTERTSFTSGTESKCPPFEYSKGDYLGPNNICDYLSYSNLSYDVKTGIYTAIPTTTAIKNYQTMWYVEKIEFTVKNGKIETYRMTTYRNGTLPGTGDCTFTFSFDFKFSNIGTTKVPGYVYNESQSLADSEIKKLINKTGENFTLTSTISSSAGTFVSVDRFNGQCMYSVSQHTNADGEYSHDVDCFASVDFSLLSSFLRSLDATKIKLNTGSDNEYTYSEELKCNGETFINIRLITENGRIKSLSYETKNTRISYQYVFENLGSTTVNCPF